MRHTILVILVILLFPLMPAMAQRSITSTRLEVTSVLDAKPDTVALHLLEPYKEAVDSTIAPVIGRSLVAMDAGRPESLLGNWVADALVEHSVFDGGERADLGIVGVGSLRNNLPEGDVRQGDALLVCPFHDYLAVAYLSGDHLLTLMEEIASLGGEAVSHEVRMLITKDGRLQEAIVNGQPIDREKVYRVATLDYFAEGNDGMTSFAKAQRVVTGDTLVRHLLVESVRRAGIVSSSLEGRIRVADMRTLTLVHTGDTHSCIEPDRTDNAGFVRRAALLGQLREESPDLLLLDSGDFSQGSLYYTLFGGEAEIALMNGMRYDATAIGNHEFDCGLDNLARLLRMAQFPFVCCNLDFTGTPCEGLVKPYTVVERAGMRIGILGVSPQLDGMVAKSCCEGVVWQVPAEAAQRVVNTLRNEEHCDVVICLSHLGYGGDKEQQDDDQALIGGTRGIDVVLGGHSHTYWEQARYFPNADGKPVPLDHQGKNGRYVGIIRLCFD